MSLRTGFAPLMIGFICVYLGTYDGTAWAVVLPEIAEQLELDLIVAQWVVLAPIIMTAALLLVMGNLADKIGHRQVLYYGLAAYVAGALLVILSSGFAPLIVARFLMGASMAVLFTVGPAFTVRAFVPSQRARALAVVGVTTSIGLVSGPLLGGLITTIFGWRNLPVADAGDPGGLFAGHLYCQSHRFVRAPLGDPPALRATIRPAWGGAHGALAGTAAFCHHPG